jgi:hypothetical protein
MYTFIKKISKSYFQFKNVCLKIAKRSFPVQVTASLSIKVKMEAFFKKYSEKINEKSVLNRQGCMIWQGCIKKGPVGYGVINAKFPDAQWHTMHVHRLLYLVHNKILYVEPDLEV